MTGVVSKRTKKAQQRTVSAGPESGDAFRAKHQTQESYHNILCRRQPQAPISGVFAKFVPKLKLYCSDKTRALSAPDNAVGGAFMRTIPVLSKAGLTTLKRGEM